MGTVDDNGYYLAEEQVTEPLDTPRVTHNEQAAKGLREALEHIANGDASTWPNCSSRERAKQALAQYDALVMGE